MRRVLFRPHDVWLTRTDLRKPSLPSRSVAQEQLAGAVPPQDVDHIGELATQPWYAPEGPVPVSHRLMVDGIDHFAEAMHGDLAERFDGVIEFFERHFGEMGMVTGRLKTPQSIERKIHKYGSFGHETLAGVMGSVNDPIAAKVILDDCSQKGIEIFLQELLSLHRMGELTFGHVDQYGSRRIPFYLTPQQEQPIIDILTSYSVPSRLVRESYSSGYVGTHFDLIVDGLYVDLHLRGPLVDRFYQSEHVLYQIRRARSDKDLPQFESDQLQRFAAVLMRLPPYKKKIFLRMVRNWYAYFRALEMGKKVRSPRVPAEIRPYLRGNDLFNMQKFMQAVEQEYHLR